MAVVNTKELIKTALENKMIIPAFNVHNIEMCRSILEAAEEENYPVIIQSTPKSIELSGYKVLYSVVKEMAEKKNETIRKARIDMDCLTGDAEIKRLAELREKWEMDYNSGIDYAKKEGEKLRDRKGRKASG